MKEFIGQSLGRYQLVSLLGEGGMGAVFKGRDITLQRDVAVKIMHPHIAAQPSFRERFLQEARSAAKLDHPGVVKVHDFSQARGHFYIVMEFIPGDNLRQMLEDLRANGQWILLPEALALLHQVCLALHYAHQAGVVHRDIKPDNIMLKPKPGQKPPYQAVLTDLGLVKLAEGGLVTQDGISMGTPAYMSPEQANGLATDARSDVYSLGILLFELAVGQLPFRVHTLTEAIRCHTYQPPAPPRSLHPDLPEALETIILKALEKKPDDRFPDVQALAGALAAVLPWAAVTSAPPTAHGGAVSLMTRVGKSLVEERGPSLIDQFPPTPPDLTQDRLVVLAPDGSAQPLPMKRDSLTIGRSVDNDLVLDHPRVSRQHARVDPGGKVAESNEGNNASCAPIRIQ